jgi:hypothetical protein
MKKFLFLVVLGIAAWQAWKHYPSLFERRPSHEAVIENQSQRQVVKFKLMVAGQTLVRESIPQGRTEVIPFRISRDGPLGIEWEWSDATDVKSWSGGSVVAGPSVQRYIITIEPGGKVLYRVEPKGTI